MAASPRGLHSSSAHDCKGTCHGASLFVVNIASPSRPAKASVLPAILTVIALVVLVGSLAVGARRFADEKAALNAGVVSHARVMGVLERYKTEFQDYPAPARPDETVVIDGRTFPVGAAMMFYQILSGDGTDQISVSSTTGKPSDGTIDNDEPSSLALGLEWFPWKHLDGRWFAVDVHGHPFQYQKGGTPDAVNPTYDLWSYNGDASAIGLHDAATKRDPVKTARWIKNFPIKAAVPEPTK
jgi:hypothetical protein